MGYDVPMTTTEQTDYPQDASVFAALPEGFDHNGVMGLVLGHTSVFVVQRLHVSESVFVFGMFEVPSDGSPQRQIEDYDGRSTFSEDEFVRAMATASAYAMKQVKDAVG